MSIKSREDANKYYQIINELVDEYVEKWKIRPSKLKRYLQPGSERFVKFLKKNNLDSIGGSSRILQDVIEDRYHMESDGVVTFESFKVFESSEFKINSMKGCLYKGIEKATIDYEKVLADHFDTNLGSIDVVDSDKHMFMVNGWEGQDVTVVIYSNEDLELIKFNMVEHLFSELTKKTVEIVDGISVSLGDLIKNNMFEQEMNQNFERENLLQETISKCLGMNFLGESRGFCIWISAIM